MPSSTSILALLGAIASTFAQCVIPIDPPSINNTITEPFQLFVQNISLPIIHDRILNFLPNGADMHLVLRPDGEDTYDTIWLDNGFMRNVDRYAVIDLQFNPVDNTTKMFLTDRTYALALFEAIWCCDEDTGELQTCIKLLKRLADPAEGQAEEDGGKIGIQEAGLTGDYEVRYTPANNSLLNYDTWFDVQWVIFRDGITPPDLGNISMYEYVGCYAEDTDGSRALTGGTFADEDAMTNEECAIDCAGSVYFGTEYFYQCYCGDTISNLALPAPESDCNAPCVGNTNETCGGADRLSLYRLKSNSSAASSSSSSSLSSTSSSFPSSSSSTSSSLSTTTPPSSSTSSTSVSSTSTSTTSTTLSTSTSTTSTTLSTSTSTTSTASSTVSGTGLPTDPATVGLYSYVGCWAEPLDGSRALTDAFEGTEEMTVETCAAFCHTFPYFGTEWSSECWCGYNLTGGSASTGCDYTCAGDSTELCGGSRLLSLYQNLAWEPPSDPATIAGYEYYGCVTDGGARTLYESSIQDDAMTLEECATFCEGYEYFGAEWSIQCFCGNGFLAGAALVDDSECDMLCGGNEEELCGAGDLLSVYQLVAV
ncbi:WSC-domain-containing protein [Hyaloscypha variabilis F]|uniref:WSC-domain-containing protein n=1 Tax=Hyaloscypha variabilis (strain UAMH 11265 / GT02V1 / F) TaxID=1149755 RepID=A0A2J6QR86_HYAVF|nr:WSC-domain-containing protein [Hyaloscypha variabilis F]